MYPSPAGPTSSPRRRRDLYGDGLSVMRRTASNNSSTSSDILVAAPSEQQQQQPPPPPPPPSQASSRPTGTSAMSAAPTRSYVAAGYFTVRFASDSLKDALRQILSKAPHPSDYHHSSDHHHETDDSEDEAVVDDDEVVEEVEGPNHRGTYSKEYVLKHPEIDWIHRGQGRYLPASELKPDPIIWSPRPTRHANSRTTTTTATTSDTTDMMFQALAQEFDDHRRTHNAAARDKWSPVLKHQFNLISDLFKNTPRSKWLKACDQIKDTSHGEVAREWVKAMERQFPSTASSVDKSQEARARPSRQAKSTSLAAVPSIEHRRSSRLVDAPSNYDEGDEEADYSDVSESPDRTFTREYVDAHPKEEFYHTGNGYYRRGSRTTSMTRCKRRESSHSQVVKDSSSDVEDDVDVDEEETVKGDELYKYPGIVFHHKGNSYYKRGVAPNGRKGTFVVGANGDRIPYDPKPKTTPSDRPEVKLRNASATALHLEPHATVRREVTEKHPEFEWTHVGGGWFRRKDSTSNLHGAGFTTPAASSERRSSRVSTNVSRDYPESHVGDEMTRTSERRKRASRHDAGNDIESLNGSQSKIKPPLSISRSDSSELFDVHYVNAHPDEVFHHRGQGRWARGLPPPGSSNKIAVRGPVDEAERNDRPVNEHGELAPLPTALLRREEGPDKWPQLRWVYRGGGKWCQKTKEEIEADARAPLPPPHKKQRTSIGSRSRGEDAEAQLRREALAAQPKRNKGKAPASNQLLKPAKIVRRRSQQSVLLGGDTSKASSGSQSKAPTPKPAPLSEELDKLTAEDLPSFWKDEWSEDENEDPDDPATRWLRDPANGFRPIKGWQPMVAAMEKYLPGSRSLDSLKALAANAQSALKDIQDEYLLLDQVVARNPIKGNERNPVKGGRVAVSHEIWEDKKESTLYDYVFDAKKIGYQDPNAQKIVRDAEGRELRRRRNRNDIHATQVDYGDGEMTARRAIKPVSRFDGVIIAPPRKRSRMPNPGDGDDITPSMTPERGNTPALSLAGTINADGAFVAATRGRWAGHVPKRIRELRGESVSSQRSASTDGGSSQPGQIRKGRPPGSKNQHKRKDAGIKKGPRKPKVSSEPQQGDMVSEQSVTATEPPPPIPRPDPMSLDAIISPQSASA
ncbi:hypothetical protein AC579_10009 [Pseudocercospora musae]|uniref:Uncharacterized protein n=1 Tax=Pseudocercospora musae TaxID=113226 RepID=A0A139I8Y6_9PEZI|nr:hypothetical protein AC579_10009 [Pseudocercospora musae]